MTSPKLGDLREGEQFEGFYAVREASLLTTAGGKPYIRLTLADATGALSANVWDATADLYQSFAVGGVIKVRGVTETFKNKLQAKITALRPAHESEVKIEDFLPTGVVAPEELAAGLDAMLASVADQDLRALLDAFFADAAWRARFCRAPAAKENHHAWVGGLLEHSLAVARLADAFARENPDIDRDELVTGALLHDAGKVDELSLGLTIDYTDIGRLLGHLVLGAMMIEERARALPRFPEEKRRRLQHLILSHHGKREYGSPILPATPEAVALHHLDNLDAKAAAVRRLLAADTDPARHWTERSWMLETPLFKGFGQ